jgi:hypothetical protein
MVEKQSVAIDASEISRSGGQKQLKSFRILHLRRKPPRFMELTFEKDFEPEKVGGKERRPGLGTQDPDETYIVYWT